jgi:hypothetical protein
MKNKEIKKDLMQKIKTGRVVMKPRWGFTAIKVGLKGSWLVAVGILAVGIAAIYFFINRYNPIELASFGDIGWEVFYEDFPYLYLTMVVMFLVGGTLILVRIGDNYKKGIQKLGLITLLGAILLAGMLVLFQRRF